MKQENKARKDTFPAHIAKFEEKTKEANIPYLTKHYISKYIHLATQLSQHNNIKAQDQNLDNILHMAAAVGNLEGVEWLVDQGADINATGHDKETSLMYASRMGHYDVAKFLIEKGANINAEAEYTSHRAIEAAVNSKHSEIVKLLLEKGAGITSIDKESFIQKSVRNNDIETTKILLAHGVDTNNQQLLNTALTTNHNIEMAEMLVNYNPSLLSEEGRPGETLLQTCAAFGFKNEVEFLLNHNADVNTIHAHDNQCETALSLANDHGKTVLRMLAFRDYTQRIETTEQESSPNTETQESISLISDMQGFLKETWGYIFDNTEEAELTEHHSQNLINNEERSSIATVVTTSDIILSDKSDNFLTHLAHYGLLDFATRSEKAYIEELNENKTQIAEMLLEHNAQEAEFISGECQLIDNTAEL